jgi:hypothetical protein
MKRLLLSVCLAALLPALAQAQTVNPNAKVDPKNNKVSRPVVEKPKQVLMTRDELRACMKTQAANDEEAKAIKVVEAEQKAEREALLAAKNEFPKREEALAANVAAIKAEQDALLKMHADISAQASKLEKAELKAKQDEYMAKANALNERIEAHNKTKDAYLAERKNFDSKVDAHNKAKDELSTRVDNYFDKHDEWKKSCANKAYDEADEIAIKKEMK